MKTLGKNKTGTGPCKSPSPDLHNRSIIKGTTIEVDNIKSKMKEARERQQLFELESSFSQNLPSELNASYQNKYRQLYDQFSKLKNENRYLAEQNQLLNQENKRISLHDQRHKTISQLTGALLSKHEQEPLRQRVFTLDQQRAKLQEELVAQRVRRQQAQQLSQNLRMELLSVKEQSSRLREQQEHRTCLSIHQNRLTSLSNTIINSFSQTYREKLDVLNCRLNKVELMEKIIKEQHSRLIADSRINRTPVSFKHEEKDTLSTSVKPYREDPSSQDRLERSLYGLGYSHEFEQSNPSNFYSLKAKQQEIEALKEENQRLSTALKQLQREKSKIKLTPLKSKQQKSQSKISELEEELQVTKKQRNTLSDKLVEAQKNYDSDRHNLLSTIENLQKSAAMQQMLASSQCQICLQKDEQIAVLETYNQQLEQQLAEIKETVLDIQKDAQAGDISELLNHNYEIYEQTQQNLCNRNQTLVQQVESYRYSLGRKEEQNARLETQLQLKIKEVELLSMELDKMKKIHSQYNQPHLGSDSLLNNQGRQDWDSRFRQNNLQILEKWKQKSSRLALLFSQVASKDMEQAEDQSKIRCIS